MDVNQGPSRDHVQGMMRSDGRPGDGFVKFVSSRMALDVCPSVLRASLNEDPSK